MKPLIGLSALILLFSLSTRAQIIGGSIGTGSSLSSVGSLSQAGSLNPTSSSRPTAFSPPAQFRMTITSGSAETFVPSSFVTYDQALAAGAADSFRSFFMPYDQAIAKGIADLAAKPKSLAQVAQEYRREERPKSAVKFIQDSNGRVVESN
jgi:hypothetical protein